MINLLKLLNQRLLKSVNLIDYLTEIVMKFNYKNN